MSKQLQFTDLSGLVTLSKSEGDSLLRTDETTATHRPFEDFRAWQPGMGIPVSHDNREKAFRHNSNKPSLNNKTTLVKVFNEEQINGASHKTIKEITNKEPVSWQHGKPILPRLTTEEMLITSIAEWAYDFFKSINGVFYRIALNNGEIIEGQFWQRV